MFFKVGMYGGAFNPPHLGHIECINTAATLCEELYIVLSVGTKRNEMDVNLRYRYLYQLTSHLPNVKIIVIEDDAPSKEAYTLEYWQKDADKIKAAIGKKIDIIVVGSDYDEKTSPFRTVYPDSLIHVIPRSNISSTQIRKHPFKYWDYIPDIVKPYYCKKVLLMGSESTGKSTMTQALRNRFNAASIHEVGRDISLRSNDPNRMLSSDYVEILLQHKLNEINAVNLGKKLLIEDTEALTTLFYMDFLNDSNVKLNAQLATAIDALNNFDLIIFLEADVTFVQDGSRADEILHNRAAYSQRLKDLLTEHNHQFIVISGDYNSRYIQAVSLISNLLNE